MFNLPPWKRQATDGGKEVVPNREHPLSQLRNEFEAMFDRVMGRLPSLFESEGTVGRFWEVNIDETEKDVVVRAEAPGFEANDFDLRVSGNQLTIQAERKQEKEEKKGDYHIQERHYGHFRRSIPLPAGIDSEKVEARYRNGVLEVRLPKTAEAQTRRIEVKSDEHKSIP